MRQILKTATLALAIVAFAVPSSQRAVAAGSDSSKKEHAGHDHGKGHHHLFGNHECPATGDKVDPKAFYEYKDEENGVYGRIYLCCPGCAKKVKKDPKGTYEKYYRTDPKTGKKIEPKDLKNTECPVTGDEVDPKSKIEYNGMIVHFCCKDCIKSFLKKPDKYLEKLVPDAEKYEFEPGGGSGSAK